MAEELEGVGVFSKTVVRASHTRLAHNQSSQNANMKSHLSLRATDNWGLLGEKEK